MVRSNLQGWRYSPMLWVVGISIGFLGMGFLVTGCANSGPRVVRLDPDQDDSLGGTGIESSDLRSVTKKMATDILNIPQIARAASAPIVVVDRVVNSTSFHIDGSLFTNRISTLLLQHAAGRVQFAARDEWENILKERKMKREGVVSSSGEKALAGADFFLKGELQSIEKRFKDAESTYILYTFKLVDAESSLTVWQNQAEIKKEGWRGTLYR